jgi:hypothetical protein
MVDVTTTRKITDLEFHGVIACPLCGSRVTRYALMRGDRVAQCITIIWKLAVVVVLWLLLTLPAFAVPITYNFAGTLADGGNVSGQWTLNSPTITYSAFTLNPLYDSLPLQQAVITSYCSGPGCLFGGAQGTRLFASGSVSTLRLIFDLNLTTIDFNSSWLESRNADGSFHSLIMVKTGTVQNQNSVPIPDTMSLWLLSAGMLVWFQRFYQLDRHRGDRMQAHFPAGDGVLLHAKL